MTAQRNGKVFRFIRAGKILRLVVKADQEAAISGTHSGWPGLRGTYSSDHFSRRLWTSDNLLRRAGTSPKLTAFAATASSTWRPPRRSR
jgi:hypothetical protein